MATITTKIIIYVDKYNGEVLTEKQIKPVIDEYIKDFYADEYEVDCLFHEMCVNRDISYYDIFTMNEERKDTIREVFEKVVKEKADYYINDNFNKHEIEVELDING